MDLRIGFVSTTCPRLKVQVTPRSDVVLPEVVMLIRRAGDATDFGSYTPIAVVGNVLTFQFDDQLFARGFYGRYESTLTFNRIPYASLQFQYTSDVGINPAQQLSTIGPYNSHEREYGNPDWSGTGIAGPGTFIGLKDCPKSYAGASGQTVSVRTDEKGLIFAPFQVATYATGQLPGAPPHNGVLAVHGENGGGLAYSMGGYWIDVRTQGIVS
jgi:hypothetical protein